MKLPISLVVITLNEEKNIGRCLLSAGFASEKIVVDSLSTDKTREIATDLGAKVVERKFQGYRSQKEFALKQATQPWVLSLDADEALSPSLAQEIKSLFPEPEYDGYRMPRLSRHLNRWIWHGGWHPDYQTRLFKKEKAQWQGGEIHEYMNVEGSVGTLKKNILHYVFRDLEDQLDTNNEFSTLGTADLINRQEKFRPSKLIIKPIGKFFECYFWKRGFLDGAAGFIIALGAAQSIFLKYAKLWEFWNTKKNESQLS